MGSWVGNTINACTFYGDFLQKWLACDNCVTLTTSAKMTDLEPYNHFFGSTLFKNRCLGF